MLFFAALAFVACSSSAPAAVAPTPTLTPGERFRTCLTETVAGQEAEDAGRLARTYWTGSQPSVAAAAMQTPASHPRSWVGVRPASSFRPPLLRHIEQHAREQRSALSLNLAKREVDQALAAAGC